MRRRPALGSYLEEMDDDLLYSGLGFRWGPRRQRLLGQAACHATRGVRKDFQKRLKKDGVAYLFAKDGDSERQNVARIAGTDHPKPRPRHRCKKRWTN